MRKPRPWLHPQSEGTFSSESSSLLRLRLGYLLPFRRDPRLRCDGLVCFAQSFPLFPQCCQFQSPVGKPHLTRDPALAALSPAQASPALLQSVLKARQFRLPGSLPSCQALPLPTLPTLSKSNLREPHPWIPPFLLSHLLLVLYFPWMVLVISSALLEWQPLFQCSLSHASLAPPLDNP